MRILAFWSNYRFTHYGLPPCFAYSIPQPKGGHLKLCFLYKLASIKWFERQLNVKYFYFQHGTIVFHLWREHWPLLWWHALPALTTNNGSQPHSFPVRIILELKVFLILMVKLDKNLSYHAIVLVTLRVWYEHWLLSVYFKTIGSNQT